MRFAAVNRNNEKFGNTARLPLSSPQVAFKRQTLLRGATEARENRIGGNYEAGRCEIVSGAGNLTFLLLPRVRLGTASAASQQIKNLIAVCTTRRVGAFRDSLSWSTRFSGKINQQTNFPQRKNRFD